MLKQKMVLNYAVQLLEYAIQLVSSIVVARIAGPTVFGILAFGLSYVALVNIFVSFGFGGAHIKMVSEGKDVSKSITTYALMSMANAVLLTIGVTTMYIVQKHALGIQFESSTHEKVIFINLLISVVNILLGVPNMTFVANLELTKQSIPYLVQMLLFNISRIVIVIMGYGAVAISWLQLGSLLIIIPITFRLFKGYSFGRVDIAYIKISLLYSIPLFFINVARGLTQYFDKVLLQFYVGSEGLGYYGASQRIGGLISMLGASLGMLFFPLFSKYLSEGMQEMVAQKITVFFRFCVLFIMPMVFILLFHSDVVVITILGEKYTPSIMPMKLFTLSSFFYLMGLPFGNIITGAGKFRQAMYINIFCSLFYVGTLFIMVNPRMLSLGLLGASVAVVLYNMLNGAIYVYFARRIVTQIKIRPLIKQSLFVGIVCIIVGVVGAYSKTYMSSMTGSVSIVIVSSVVLYMALIALGQINKSDYGLLKALFSRKDMAEYVKSEVST